MDSFKAIYKILPSLKKQWTYIFVRQHPRYPHRLLPKLTVFPHLLSNFVDEKRAISVACP